MFSVKKVSDSTKWLEVEISDPSDVDVVFEVNGLSFFYDSNKLILANASEYLQRIKLNSFELFLPPNCTAFFSSDFPVKLQVSRDDDAILTEF